MYTIKNGMHRTRYLFLIIDESIYAIIADMPPNKNTLINSSATIAGVPKDR